MMAIMTLAFHIAVPLLLMACYMVIQGVVTIIYGGVLRFTFPLYSSTHKNDHFQWETNAFMSLMKGRVYVVLIFSFIFLLLYFVLDDYRNVVISLFVSAKTLVIGLVAIDLLVFPVVHMVMRINVAASIIMLSPWAFVANCVALFLASQ